MTLKLSREIEFLSQYSRQFNNSRLEYRYHCIIVYIGIPLPGISEKKRLISGRPVPGQNRNWDNIETEKTNFRQP